MGPPLRTSSKTPRDSGGKRRWKGGNEEREGREGGRAGERSGGKVKRKHGLNDIAPRDGA